MVRKLALVGVLAAALAAPARSEAQFGIGARIGYAFGVGDVGGDSGGSLKMSDWISGQIPVQVDLMFHVIPGLSVGPYFSYGFGRVGGDLKDQVCDMVGVDCSSSIMRLGVQGTYTLPPPIPLWVGVGIGYEWSKLTAEGGGESGDIKFHGMELLNLQVGADFLATPVLRFGPFLMMSMGRYSDAESSGALSGISMSIPDKKVHEWFEVGVRGMFDL